MSAGSMAAGLRVLDASLARLRLDVHILQSRARVVAGEVAYYAESVAGFEAEIRDLGEAAQDPWFEAIRPGIEDVRTARTATLAAHRADLQKFQAEREDLAGKVAAAEGRLRELEALRATVGGDS